MIIIEQEDGILIQNILDGNHQAEEMFFNKYKKIIKDYIRSKYSKINNDDLDDYVSEILIKTFQCFDKYSSEKSSVKTWVLAIAKNYIIDKWRSNATMSATTGTNVYLTLTDNTSDSGYITAGNVNNMAFVSTPTINNEFENSSSLNYLSAQISSADYTLLDMKYIQGYNYNEIGKEFNVTSSTISNRVNYIKTKLKKNNIYN